MRYERKRGVVLSSCLLAVATAATAQDPASKKPPPNPTLLGSENAAVYTKIALGPSGRMMQLFDLALMRPKSETADYMMPVRDRQALGSFVRQFLDPAPGDRDDVQVVSGRWLMVVGKPELLVGAERLMAANVEHREQAIGVEVRITKVTSKLFEQVLKPHLVAVEMGKEEVRAALGPEVMVAGAEAPFTQSKVERRAQWQGLLDAKAAEGVVDVLIKDGSDEISMPRLVVSPLQMATASTRNQTAYVRDFEVEQHGDKVSASPVVDVISDGIEGRVMVLYEPDGRIGLDCELSVSELLRPIPTAEVDLGFAGAPKGVVQLPRLRGVRLRQVAHLASGEVAVVAAPRAEGGFLVAMIAVRTTR